jgi:hypothetical protein
MSMIGLPSAGKDSFCPECVTRVDANSAPIVRSAAVTIG